MRLVFKKFKKSRKIILDIYISHIFIICCFEYQRLYSCFSSLRWPLLQAIPLIYQSLRAEAVARAQSGLRSSLKFICRRFTVALLIISMRRRIGRSSRRRRRRRRGADDRGGCTSIAGARTGPTMPGPSRMINDARAVRGYVNEAMTRPTR